MILVDTSIVLVWLDKTHADHARCEAALVEWAGQEHLSVSSVTYADLAAGGRTQEAVDEDLQIFRRLDLDFASAWRAGAAFGRYSPGRRGEKAVLPDFLIRAQAATLGCRHLTNDRRRLRAFPDVEFLFPQQ